MTKKTRKKAPAPADHPWVAYDVVEGAPLTIGELNELHLDLLRCQEAQPEALPPQLWSRLRQNIEWQLIQSRWTQEDKDRIRWLYVNRGLARGVGWDAVFESASDALKGTQAAAGEHMMKKSYQDFEKRLPPEKRRPRTYRRRSCPLG